MRIYTCLPEWEAMLTCIYEAWSSGLGHNNIRLLTEPVEQETLFDEYIHVDADEAKANKVIDSVNLKISSEFYREMAFTSLACERDIPDNIYRMMILGFAYGPRVLEMLQYKDVIRNREIKCRVLREAERFQECIRFHQVGNVYVAHIEPKSRVAYYLGPVFQDRMPSENFVIIDDVHRDAVFHQTDNDYFMRKLTEDEIEQSVRTEAANDAFTDLWKVFFNSVAIKERNNPRCQLSHSPLWARKHIVEFR